MTSLLKSLTPAQEDVARLVAKGYGYVRIARELGSVSRHTVRWHVRQIANQLQDSDPTIGDLRNVMLWAQRHL